MSTYATVIEVGEQSSKPSTLGFKKVVAGAAVAAFLLGSLVAVAVAGGSAPPVLSHWDNGDCIGVRATVRPDGGNELHVGKLVERFECPSGEYRHVYTDWHME